MLLRNCVNYTLLGIIGLSILLLIYVANTKKYNNSFWTSILCIVYVIYLCIINFVIIESSFIVLNYGLELFLIRLTSFIAAILYLISNSICLKQGKLYNDENINKEGRSKSNKIVILAILFPLLLFGGCFFRERILINNSDFIIFFYSRGVGLFDGGESFAFTVNDDSCHEISLNSDYIKKGFSKNVTLVSNIEDLEKKGIRIDSSYKDNSFIIYKDEKQLCNIKIKSIYRNIKKSFLFE